MANGVRNERECHKHDKIRTNRSNTLLQSTKMTPDLLSRLPIPHRIAGFALTATLFILVLLGLAHHNFRGEILGGPSSPGSLGLPLSPSSSLRLQSYIVEQEQDESMPEAVADPSADDKNTAESYYIFLQKFPLQNTWKKLFHTEVIVCPRETFSKDTAFLNILDGLVSNTLAPSRFTDGIIGAETEGSTTSKSPFVPIEKDQWSKQTETGCVQLGYGGANCGSACCGSPHLQHNRNYALNAQKAVIGNAMTEYKELYFYGVSGSAGGDGGISGGDAVSYPHTIACDLLLFDMFVDFACSQISHIMRFISFLV